MPESKDQLWKVTDESPDRIEDLVKAAANPLGLDVGTSKLVASRKGGKGLQSAVQLNAFIPVAWSPFTEKTIQAQSDISYYRDGDEIIIYGTATERFANMFNAKARTAGETLAFSVPAALAGKEAELVYHEATLRKHFQSLGFRAIAVNEGLAVIFAELESENFTGIGISCGGGMCNATLAYLSIPSIMFSIAKGGDFIDRSVGAVVDEHATRVKSMKEEGLDLGRAPHDKFEKALHIYYEDLVESLVDGLRKALSTAEKLPRTDRPLPIVLSGGAAKPKGFRELFERTLRSRSLPIEIAEIRVASEPLTATARGALIAAMYEK